MTDCALKTRIVEDMKAAMRAQDKARLQTLRMTLAELKQKEVDERIELDDAAVSAILEKMVKKRRESITQFQAGNRPDLVAHEEQEITVLATYLPEPCSAAEITACIQKAIQDTGAQGQKDMGKVMAAVKAKLAGRADMSVVSQEIKTTLAAM
jgi:hypothetical protein